MRPSFRSVALLSAVTAFGCAEADLTEPTFELETAFAKGGNVHQVRGSGHITRLDAKRTFTFTAREDARGQVKGQANLVFHVSVLGSENASVTRQHVEVTCLSVDGNRAWIGGVIKSSTIPDRAGLQTAFSVLDGGDGAPDQVSLQGNGSANPDFAASYCAAQPDATMFDVEGGNVSVD